ncbi:MAG: L,D-transpeptidase family protein [Actinomycetales bacterium]|nr:L,D-transpeptidase family protein [Actinomycetales bacterium]
MTSVLATAVHPRRHTLRWATIAIVATLTVSACTAAQTGASLPDATAVTAGAAGGDTAAPSAMAPPVVLTPNVSSTTAVPVDTSVTVTASAGVVTDVSLTYKDAKAGAVTVGGDISTDGTKWTAHSLLEPGTTYTIAARGRSSAGVEAESTTTFKTDALTAKQQISASVIGNGMTVGVAMPVVVMFSSPVTDQAAFERALSVTATPAQEGAWSWFSSREAHWRPAKYWEPGTKVSVKAAINGVAAGKGTFGKDNVTGGFTVGSSLVMQADLASHKMTVMSGDTVLKVIPITGGKKGYESRSGTKVIVSKHETYKMDAATLGVKPGDPEYYSLTVKYAMRETWSGEFVHAAPWSVRSQGSANVSHGCIGMSTANASWLFKQAKVGDPIVVSGTPRSLERGNGYTDWNISFEEFKKGSALS